MKELYYSVLILYVLICAVQDAAKRQISLEISLAAAVVGIAGSVIKKREAADLLMAMIPGILILFLSLVSRGGIGMGDAIFTMICGAFLQCSDISLAVILSWSISGAIGLIVIVGRMFRSEKGRTNSIPFVSLMAVPILYTAIQNGIR